MMLLYNANFLKHTMSRRLFLQKDRNEYVEKLGDFPISKLHDMFQYMGT